MEINDEEIIFDGDSNNEIYFVPPKSIFSSISRNVEKQIKNTVDEVVEFLRTADNVNIPDPGLQGEFRLLPDDAFKQIDGNLVAKSGEDLGTWSKKFRSGYDNVFEESLEDIGLDATQNFTVMKKLNISKFPENKIIDDEVRHARDAPVVNETNLPSLSTDQLNAAGNAADNSAASNLWTNIKKYGKIVLATGAVVAAGVGLGIFISDAIDLESGCFLVQREGNKVVYYRILGYSCNTNGDNLWVGKGLPTIEHPFDAEIKNLISNGDPCTDDNGGCHSFCDQTFLASTFPDAFKTKLADNQTIICKTATIGDIISDVSDSIGSDVGNIIGGVVGGATGGIVDGIWSSLGGIFFLIIFLIVGIVIFKTVFSGKSVKVETHTTGG